MPQEQEDEPSHLFGWKRETNSGVVDFRREFLFSRTVDSCSFITDLMSIEHHGIGAIIETTSCEENKLIEVAVSSVKEELAKQLLKLIEDIYNRTTS